tara:strand:+ start:355 stop:852 length:498 start_codon:yes stop_codon:yes gene_type:complete
MTAPGLPWADEVRTYLEDNPGSKLATLVDAFAPEGVDTTHGTSFYWAMRDFIRRSGVAESRGRRWYAVERPPPLSEGPTLFDDPPPPPPPPMEPSDLARHALDVKRRIGAQKHLTANFANGVAKSINRALDEISTAASEYNQKMRQVEHELQNIANELQLSKVTP